MSPPKRFRKVAKVWSIKEVGRRINSLLQKKAGVGSAGGSVTRCFAALGSTPALQKKGKRKGEGGRLHLTVEMTPRGVSRKRSIGFMT